MDEKFVFGLTKVTSFVVMAHQSTKAYHGTPQELERVYKKVLLHNLLAGWWSLPGVIWTIMALVRNAKRLKELRAVMTPPHGHPS